MSSQERWMVVMAGMMVVSLCLSSTAMGQCAGQCSIGGDPCVVDADCPVGETCIGKDGSGTFKGGSITIDGGQISMAGATLFVDFFTTPASTNDWIDVDGDGLAGYFFPVFPYVDQLAKQFVPTQNLNTWWNFQYRAIGSVNGFNQFVDNQTCSVIPITVPSEKGIFNGFLYAVDGELQWSGGDNDSGTPLEPCEIEGAFLDVPSSWAIQVAGTPAWYATPLSDGYGQGSGIPSSNGTVSELQTLSRDCGQCRLGGEWCVKGSQCAKACVLDTETFSGSHDECDDDDDCTAEGEVCMYEPCDTLPTLTCSNSGDPCSSDADCPLYPAERCVGPGVSLNKNFDFPDANTLYDFVAAWVPVSIIANRGTDIENVKYSEAQYLWTTGRMPSGENLVAATRDVGSGTRNAAMNSLGIDTSWARGDNLGSKTKDKKTDNLGSAHQPTNKGGSSRMEGAVQNNRLAVGYTGLAGGSRSAIDAAAGKYEILNVCKDVDVDGDGHPDCDCSTDGYVRVSVDNILDNCDPCTGYQIAGSGSFVVRGDIDANRTPPVGTNPPLDNQAVADYLINIFDSIASFEGDVFGKECDATKACSVKRCSVGNEPCQDDADCGGGETCEYVWCIGDDDCENGETCDIQGCGDDDDCPMLVCSVSRVPCFADDDCLPDGGTCTEADFCKSKLNMPGQMLATTFFLPAGLDCLHRLDYPLAYESTATNPDLQAFIRNNSVIVVPGYGSVNPGGLVPKRNSVAMRSDTYSDGSLTGSYVYWNGSSFVTNLTSGVQLSERNGVQGDFDNDFARDVNDATELVMAYYTPRAWQQSAAATGSGDTGDMSRDNAIPEVIGDFNGDGNLNKEDIRYFADGLAMVGGQLDRKQGHIAIDNAIAGLGRPFPWADAAWQLLVPPTTPGNEPTFAAPADVNDPIAPFLKTGKPYAAGDFRGDVGGAEQANEGRAPVAGTQPLGWDGLIDEKDITYVCRNIGDWADLDEAIFMDLSCDMDGDMAVTYADVEELVERVLGTQIGDADLDGDRDEDDQGIVLATIGDPTGCIADGTCGWGDGDFNCDGVVDQTDLDILLDSDGDGVPDDQDNCPEDPNPDQEDFDGDAMGDVCDPDIDNDGVMNDVDVCDYTPLGALVEPDGSVLGDLDEDCDVDLEDYAILQVRYTGPNG